MDTNVDISTINDTITLASDTAIYEPLALSVGAEKCMDRVPPTSLAKGNQNPDIDVAPESVAKTGDSVPAPSTWLHTDTPQSQTKSVDSTQLLPVIHPAKLAIDRLGAAIDRSTAVGGYEPKASDIASAPHTINIRFGGSVDYYVIPWVACHSWHVGLHLEARIHRFIAANRGRLSKCFSRSGTATMNKH
jgi:hypothetical protein